MTFAAVLRRGGVALAALVAATGCASGSGYAPAARIDAAVTALRDGDYAGSAERLAEVGRVCGGERLGGHARVLLGALELDPRNPDRDPDRAAARLAESLAGPDPFPWSRPVVETLYLLALESGGAAVEPRPGPTRNDRCDEPAAVGSTDPAPAPTLPGSRAGHGPALRRENDRLERRVAELERELERVRKAVAP